MIERSSRTGVLVLLVVWTYSSLSHGTTVVAIWTSTRIIIAADSKEVLLNSAGRVAENGTVCKRGTEGPIHYGVAGLYSHIITGFSVPDVADKTFETWKNHPENGLHFFDFDMAFFDVAGGLGPYLPGEREFYAHNFF